VEVRAALFLAAVGVYGVIKAMCAPCLAGKTNGWVEPPDQKEIGRKPLLAAPE
jgi:hypothetical protein